MGIRMAENLEQANAITHGGTFHADDLFAAVILSKVMDVRLYRALQMPEEVPEGVLVFDIGGGKYDHHQKNKEMRKSGTPYAAFGLIYRDYGRKALKAMGCPEEYLDKVSDTVERKFVLGIDIFDNGWQLWDSLALERGVSLMLGLFNSTWDEEMTSDEAFLKAFAVADQVFERAIRNYVAGAKAELFIEEAIEVSENHCVVLDRYLPWKGILLNSKNPKASDIWYIIFPSNRGGFSCQSVPANSEDFSQRHPVPEAWWGQPADQLAQMTGIEDCLFIHHTGFLAIFKTQESARKYALLAAMSGEGDSPKDA